MDARLLEYYNRELRYLRDLGGEFAEAFPKVAGRLGLDAFECADPYVERLLEGFAFMAARVQLKMDAEFPRFTEQLLDALCPHYLGPTPSMAVVQFKPDPTQGALNDGFVLPRGTSLLGTVRPGELTACQYRTGHDVTMWPVELTGLTHPAYTGDLGQLRFPSRVTVRGTLRARLRTTNSLPFSALSLDALTFFVRGNDALSLRLFELLLCGNVGVAVREPGATSWVTGATIQPLGLEDSDALLPSGPRSFQGYRLLHEYFAFPNRFLFAELANLGPAVRQCAGRELEIVIALDRHEPAVETAMNPGHVALFCAPAINLFPKTADRIHLTDRDHEYHVVADRTRPMDFEVQSVLDVTGFGPRGDVQRHFTPLYTCRTTTDLTEDPAYFTVHRRPRRLSGRQQLQGPRSSYVGGEVFLSLVDGREGPYSSSLRQLGVSALCTNRDLPLRMPVDEGPTDFFVEKGAPVISVRCVAGPSLPQPSHPPGDGTWRLISHLSLNYLSLTDAADGGGALALRDLLMLYAALSDTSTRRQIEGIRSAVGRPKVRRLPLDGPASFARGVEVTLECDESAFEGTSVVLLGLVMDRFFSKYVSINSFAETVLRSMQRGEIVRWPPRIGRRAAT